MKYQRKPEIVEVIKYESGMEDGFTCSRLAGGCQQPYDSYYSCDVCPIDIPKEPYKSKKYIYEDHNLLVFKDSILIDVISQEMLEEFYEPILKEKRKTK